MLKKYISSPKHIIQHEPLEIKENATYVEKPIRVIDTKEQVLRNMTIHGLKVLSEDHSPEEATWELCSQVLKKYPHLLP